MNTDLVIQFEKMAVNLCTLRNCMKIGHGSNSGIQELKEFYLFLKKIERSVSLILVILGNLGHFRHFYIPQFPFRISQ